jgi:hypothetical protein
MDGARSEPLSGQFLTNSGYREALGCCSEVTREVLYLPESAGVLHALCDLEAALRTGNC